MHSPSTTIPSIHDAQDWYAAWLDETQDLSPHTVRAYVSDVRALVRDLGSAAPLTDLAPAPIRGFFEQQRATGICPSSLRRRACGIRNFCGFLEQRGHLATNPWPADGLAFRKVRSLPRALPAHDLTTLIQHLLKQAKIPEDLGSDTVLERVDTTTTLLAATLLITTGLRVAELVTFRVTDVDISNRTIHVMGKGRRERVVYLTNDWIAQLTHAYLTTRRELGIDHDNFFFNRARRPLSTSSMRTRLAKAAASAGVQRKVTPHMLRHSAATQLIESGVDIRFVQRLLGHASLATTEIYTHVADPALRRAVVSADVLRTALNVR